jgi:rSAM/selenodomain-associated transferase 2
MTGTMKSLISIIIPVYDETRIIARTIAHLFRLNPSGGMEIIVVDGSPSCNTINCISDARVRKLPCSKGRAAQMNRGASFSQGDILLFLHADTFVPVDTLQCIREVCEKKDVVAGAFALGVRSNKRMYRIIEKAVCLRTRLTGVPYGDQAIFVKAGFFRQIGGYREVPLMEDVELMRRIKATGKGIAMVPRMVQTSPRRWETEGFLYCTVRNWILITLYMLGVSPGRLVKFYDSSPNQTMQVKQSESRPFSL